MKRKDLYSIVTFHTIVSILILFLLREPIASALDKILVTPIFSKIPDDWSTFFIVAALCGAILYKIWNMRLLPNHLRFGIVLIVFYLSQRFNTFWSFYQGSPIQGLYIWDLTLVALIIAYVKDLKCSKKKEQEQEDIVPLWVEGAPIKDLEKDSFQRGHYAEVFAKQIMYMQSNRAFAIGILGEYGSGKTSFINLIREHLKENKVDIVEFNAWKSEKAERIQSDFFNHLASALCNTQGDLSTLLKAYSRKLSQMDSTVEKFLKNVSLLNQIINGSETEVSEYNKINDYLKKSDKKLVVIIDDMDRLYSDEVIEVLRLVRNTADFTNTFYLLAYEKEYIQKAIKEELQIDSRFPFMDKIVQLEVPLPKREEHSLTDLVKQMLQDKITDAEFEALNKYVFKYGFNKEWEFPFHNIFRNARDVIKFVNTFLISYSLLKKEVLFEKLFLIELLKYRYPSFYERFYQHRDHYLVLSEEKHNYLTYYGLRKVVKEQSSSDSKDKQSSLLVYLKQENYHQDDIEIINGLMLALFNKYSWSIQASNSIVYPSSFERYFRFRLADTEISEDQFKKAWDKGFSEMSNFIEKCGEENLIQQLTNRLFMVAPKQRDEFELLIRSFFLAGPLYKKAKIKSWFDYEALTILLWDYQGLQVHRFYGNDKIEYTKLLNELFDKAPFPYLFHSELIRKLNDKGQRIPIPRKELFDYQIIYFCEYVNTKGWDATAVDLMWATCTRRPYKDKDGTIKEDKPFFVDEIKPHVLKSLKNQDKTEFLKGSIKKDHGTNEFRIYPAILDLFDPPMAFRKLLKEDNTTKPEIINEFLDFFDKLLATGFTVAIKFPFETELKPKFDEDQFTF